MIAYDTLSMLIKAMNYVAIRYMQNSYAFRQTGLCYFANTVALLCEQALISACNVIIFSILLMDQFISYTHSYMV